MDNLRDGINKIGKSLENKAEDALNRMEDELDNLQDEPVPVYPTGKNHFKCDIYRLSCRLHLKCRFLQNKSYQDYFLGQQIAIGLTGGTISGAILGRVSKGAAIVVGSSLVVVTLANSYGLLDDFDKRSLSRDMREARRQLDQELRQSGLPSTNQVKDFFKKNKTMSYSGAGSFIAAAAYFFR